MTDEMFQQLLAMVAQAGEGGFVLAVIYLLQPYFTGLIIGLVILGVTRAVMRMNDACNVVEVIGKDLKVAIGYTGTRRPSEVYAAFLRIRDKV